ncbi:MAG: hypothetical protein EA406_09690 [Rhodospirillales bacterium]|nr:MAG: hypothetical protein EA406_09690 [Rhodospirillales bacterium]
MGEIMIHDRWLRPRIGIPLLVLLLLSLPAPGALAQDVAGTVVRLHGAAMALSPEGQARALNTGSEVLVGEQITTDRDTRLRLRLIDGAVITLGDHSTFTLAGYEPASRGVVLDLLQGVFLGVTGLLDDDTSAPMTINTPIGSFGVRGTTFWGRQGPGRMEVALLEGGVVHVEGAGVQVELDQPLLGTDVRPGEAPTPPMRWSDQRLEASRLTVAFPDE